jgi:hypothetical protein
MMVRPVVNIILPAECELRGHEGDSIVVIYLI